LEKVKVELTRKEKELINANQRVEMLGERVSKKEEESMALSNELKVIK